MSFTEPLGAPNGGDSYSASHNVPDLPAPPAYDDDVVDEEKLDNYDADQAVDLGEDDDDLDLEDDLEIDDDDDGLIDDVDPEVSTEDQSPGRTALYD